ncbi:MAG: urate hydroxylase PuuD, partial [Geminicoccales bacterium]
ELTWFKYEAYSTWLSGFVLLGLIYYLSADLFLIDPAVLALPVWAAVLISVASLALGWVIYDQLCKSRLGDNTALLCALGFVFLVAASWGYTQVFSGRGAYIHAGALIGTIMVANVFFVIIPNQKIVAADLIAGRTPDPALGEQAKQRSLHNNYLTLPVLFLMISNHHPLSFEARWSWLIVAVVIIVGAVIRHFYNMRHAGRPSPWWTWAVATAGMALVVWLSAARPALEDVAATPQTAPQPVSFAEVENIVLSRCSMCHAAEPFWEGIAAPPKGIRLDTPEMIRAHAPQIRLQATLTHAMPPGNITAISPEERQILAAWIAAGAPTE